MPNTTTTAAFDALLAAAQAWDSGSSFNLATQYALQMQSLSATGTGIPIFYSGINGGDNYNNATFVRDQMLEGNGYLSENTPVGQLAESMVYQQLTGRVPPGFYELAVTYASAKMADEARGQAIACVGGDLSANPTWFLVLASLYENSAFSDVSLNGVPISAVTGMPPLILSNLVSQVFDCRDSERQHLPTEAEARFALGVQNLAEMQMQIALVVTAIATGIVKNPLLAFRRDPLVLDLDGDGIELVSLAGSTAHFDYGGDGFAERTGWVRPDDGILVFDRNQNGTVDGIGEMFGSATQDGFEVLDTLDSNQNVRLRLEIAFPSASVVQRLKVKSISIADHGAVTKAVHDHLRCFRTTPRLANCTSWASRQ